MKSSLLLLPILALLTALSGCMSTPQNAEFAKTVNFSSLDTFSFKHTLVTGMDFRSSEEFLLEELSEQTIVSELEARGFEQTDSDSDFFAVVKWKKSVSSYADPFDHIDPYSEVVARRDDPSKRFAARLHLTLEIYESSTRNLFWRKDLPNIFDALQLTEERVVDSLRLAVKNFPQHIEKDPNLPNIE
ncbi:hypothetical protein ACWPKO_13595 [Coraliomargarita sp. W4R53]